MMMFLMSGLNNLYALVVSLTPRKNTFFALTIKLSPFLIWNMCIRDTPKNFEVIYGWFSTVPCFFWRHVLNRKGRTSIQKFKAYGRKVFGMFPFFNKLLTMLRMILFLLSNTLFCCGVYATVSYLWMPCWVQNVSNSFEQYSPPRSAPNVLIEFFALFSAWALKLLNVTKASNLFCKKNTHVFRLRTIVNKSK